MRMQYQEKRRRLTGATFAVTLLIAILALAAGNARAAEEVATLKTTAKVSGDKMTLQVSGVVSDDSDWLGVSFYKPNYIDPIWEAEHKVYSIPKGKFTETYTVLAGYEGGTYEVAQWRDKLAAKLVYRMDGICGYGSGAAASGAYARTESDTIPELKTELETRDGKLYLKISGRAPDKNDWLGVSFYPADYSAVADGEYSVFTLPRGDFTKTCAVPDHCTTGTYETALWKNLGEKKEIYKLGTMRAYGSGSLPQ